MNQKNPEDVSFQVTVNQLTVASQLSRQDIHVTVAVGEVSKITCSGKLSEDGLIVTWNHPFFFTATPSTTVEVAICILPEELTLEWDKQPLGDQVVTSVSSLLESGDMWHCHVSELSAEPMTLSIICKASNVLIIPDEHDCLLSLEDYAWKLYIFTKDFNNIPCVSTQVEVNLARLDLCPSGHTDHITILKDLGIAFEFQYDLSGSIVDLNKAIDIKQTRLNLCPLGCSEHVDALKELALSLSRHYHIQRNPEDLDKLMEIQKKWLDLCSLDESSYAMALGEFALSLYDFFHTEGNITDLNKAIEMQEKALGLLPKDHLEYSTVLNDLAVSLKKHYEELKDEADLIRSIDLLEECLELCPQGHWAHERPLLSLATALREYYTKTGNYSNLDRAIWLLKDALNTLPAQHYHFPSVVTELASTTILATESSHAHPHHDSEQAPPLDEAFQVYKLLKKCSPTASLTLWNATQDWIRDAEEYSHSSVLEAYQTSLNTLDHFTTFNSSLDTRHATMHEARVADPANNAFSCATRHGDLHMAVEFLEQGRGILWNQLARFDISIAVLESQGDQGRKLGRNFTRLSGDLRKYAEQSGGQSMDPYWRVQREWQSVVDDIRRLDGFSRFLLPPRFEDLQQAAEYGPVIIVNASKYNCDALVVLCTRAPVHVPLRCSLNDVVQLCMQLSELTQDSHAYGTHRELYVKELLRELWSSVVEPIVTVLQDDIQLPLGSRIWWCPTSKLTTLPLHAAGPHRRDEKNLMDIYVSSYAPSLSALLRARDRLRSQRESRDASGAPNMISFAAVGQAHPSADVNLGQLPEVEHEIQRIHEETNMPPDVTFESVTGPAASIEGAVQAFRDHRWVHVACHGAQHATKPFDSWFAMGDGKLTLMRIIQERYTNSEFAFLSACHTAVGDASTPDEVLHLAAGMQFAGFNGVIGTLWRVDDSIAHQVVTRFYKEMFDRPVVDFEYAAVALNTAALETAEEVSLEKRIVFVHIGI